MKLKYVGKKYECVQLLTQVAWKSGYKYPYDSLQRLLDKIEKGWQQDRDYHTIVEYNRQLVMDAKRKHGVRVTNCAAMTGEFGIVVVLPYNAEGDTIEITATYKNGTWKFQCEIKDETAAMTKFAQLLHGFCYDWKKINYPVTIDDQELKVGEWLAALLFKVSGDVAGYCATLDAAEDRKL